MSHTETHERIQQHNLRPSAVWSSGGHAYNEISRGIADGITHCVRRLAPAPGERILDLATGTGWTSRVVARLGAQVTGVDIAPGLLAVARDMAAAEGLAIRYELGDAEALPFEDGAFDAVVSTYGIMFASRPEAAAAELTRVCRKGGRVALTTWTPGSAVGGMFQVMKAYMPPSSAPSPFDWGRRERLVELLGDAFELRFEHSLSYYREPSSDAAWQTFVEGYGPTRMLAEGLSPSARADLRRDFVAFHEAFRTDLGISVPREYCLTIGVRS